MSWVKENCLSFFQLFCIKVLKTGRIPQHVAFIMDGNRRYAKKNSVDTSAGHYKGFDKLSEVLKWYIGGMPQGILYQSTFCQSFDTLVEALIFDEQRTRKQFMDLVKWCLDLGIREVTVYAFSIENFKRSKEEVDGLMDLARDKFQRLMEEIDQINEWGVRMHVAGRLSLLPEDLRRKVSKSMLATRHNNKLRLNIAYAYTGRDEISRAASHIVDGVQNSEIMAQDIDDELVSKTLELGEPDLLVRTSGEVRLSDFMIWQVSNTVLYFTEALWPEFTIWNLLAAIIHFQRHAPPPKEAIRVSDTKQQFLDKLESQRWKQIEKLVSCP